MGATNLELRDKAIQACALAYAAQPVKQPDGSTLNLCWRGRLHRALLLTWQAQQAGDAAQVATLEKAVAQLEAAMNAAYAKATAACAAAGISDADAMPAPCQCAWCVHGENTHAQGQALGLARAALWALVMPGQGATLPAVVQLIQTADQASSRDQLWHRLKELSDNLQAYAQASQALGETPKWEYVWP